MLAPYPGHWAGSSRSGDGATGPRLTITCSTAGGSWTMVLHGSLDADSVIALLCQFEQLSSGTFEQVVVDVTELTTIDRSGTVALGALGERVAQLGAQLHLRYQGGTVTGVGAPPPQYRGSTASARGLRLVPTPGSSY